MGCGLRWRMFRRCAAVCLLSWIIVPFSGMCAQTRLHAGDAMPRISALSLEGKTLEVPSSRSGGWAVVVFSFSRAGGRDAQRWMEPLERDDSGAVKLVICLEAVPRLFRGIAVANIRSTMPAAMQPSTMILEQDEELWKQRLGVTNDDHAAVVLLNDGRVRWMTAGPFTDAGYRALRDQMAER